MPSEDVGPYEKALESFENGESDHFISEVLFHAKPMLDNSVIMSGLRSTGSLLNIKPQTVYSTYATIFVNESRSLTPDVLCEWMRKLSLELFGCDFKFRFIHIPTRDDIAAEYEKDRKYRSRYIM